MNPLGENDVAGVLADWQISSLIESDAITATEPCLPDQIQPASLDVRCGHKAFRLRASFLPGESRSVAACLADHDLALHSLDLRDGAVLETGCVYLIPLLEQVNLPTILRGAANPKSSTGRIDVFARLITDGATRFDTVSAGYSGALYLEVSPRTFPVLVRTGDRLAQIRFIKGEPEALRSETVTIDLSDENDPIGWRARPHSSVIDLNKLGAHRIDQFWEPVFARKGRLILHPEEFYILKSQESVQIPSDQAAEMQAIATELGEFRVHYAGFFDPGFGMGSAPSRAVLEVRCRDIPLVLEHGQAVARLNFAPLCAAPNKVYGTAGNNYQGQGLKLSKHFASLNG